jgi:hypothetical protein
MCLHLGSERHLISKVSATNNFEETIMEAVGLVLDAFGRMRDALKDLSSEALLAPPKLGSGRGKK